MEFARHEFRMGKQDPRGVTLRETYQTVERMTGKMPEDGINPVEFPESMDQVWTWFLRLCSKRPPAMAGISPIPESEIGWFFHNRGIEPEIWVLDAINELDAVAISIVTASDKKAKT